jgi:hypothetical protein
MAPRRRQPTARRPTGATLTESAKFQCKKFKKNPAGVFEHDPEKACPRT